MKRRAILLAVIAAALGFGSVALADSIPDGPNGPQIAIVNKSELANSVLATDLPYFQQALNQVCQAWHCQGTLYLGKPKHAADWIVTLNNVSSLQGAIGYHTESGGKNLAFVSIKTAVANGMPWGRVLTHEVDEMEVDPEASGAANTACQRDPSGNYFNCTFYALEVCDPVQGYDYKLGPIHASDFIYRTWFETDAKGPYDAGRHLSAPLSLGNNSYMSYYQNGSWAQTFTGTRGRWDRFGGSS